MAVNPMDYSGKDTVREHLRWLIPVLLLGFVAYVYISKRIMARAPEPTPAPDSLP